MATAYVSPVGSAAYPGTVGGPTSLTTALSSAAAGDIVYLAPGSYRGTFTLGVSGTAGNTIQFIGDPLASQAIGGIAAGVVRITNYLADNVNPTDAALFTAVSRSYWSFTGVYFEGFKGANGAAHTLTTCSNFSYNNCAFINVRSYALSITTTAGVAINASFTKCIFQAVSFATNVNCPNHSGDYNINLSYTDCTANTTLVYLNTSNANTNANGITVFNCFTTTKEGVQVYSTNTTHVTSIKNSVFYSPNTFALYAQGTLGAVVENFNLVFGSTNNITAGANSFYAGSVGIDFGYSAINALPAPSINGPYITSRLIGAGTATGAPATDIDSVAWYTAVVGMGAYTYAARNNVVGFINQPTINTITIAPASTSQSIELYLGATGLTFATSGLAAYYVRNQAAPVAITLVTQTPTGAWSSGGFAEISSSLVPGVYRLDVPNAAFAAGASDVTIVVRGASGTNGAVLTVMLINEPTDAVLVRMGPFEVRADGLGASDPLDIQTGAQHGIDIQCVDNNGAGIDITSATVTAKVYNSGATLVDTYSCTATYAADGRATFTIDTTVTNVPGTYTATITRTTGASDTQVFGPLRIYVRDI